METIALIVGLAAVFLYLLGFQFPKRKTIIACNIVSRVLYVLQYLLLGALEGAVMDLSAIPSSFFAARKHMPFVSRWKWVLLICVNGFMIALGILMWQDRLSWVPIMAVLLETNALWLSKEKYIRLCSLSCLPFWLFFNLRCGAYGSALGNVLGMISILSAIFRYDIAGKVGKQGKGN